MLMQLLAGKAARDALFLTHFEAEALPWAIGAAGVVSLASAVPAARALARIGPARLVPGLFAASALLFLAEWLAIGAAPRVVAVLLYLHLAAAGAVLISGFWSGVNERFDPHTAKREMARISSFATLGGLLGGLLSERVTTYFGIQSTLIVMGAMHGLCAALLLAMGGSAEEAHGPEQEEGPAGSGLAILRRSTYLQLMLAAVLLLAVMDALLDWAVKAQAAAVFAGSEELIRFFGIYYTSVGLATFVVQSTLVHRVLSRLGIGRSMTALPLGVSLLGGLALVIPRMSSVVAVRATASVLTNSFFRTGFELLYTPLPTRVKRPTKTYVDAGGQRVGDVLGAGLILLLLWLLPADALRAVLAAGIAVAAALVWALHRLQRAYRGQLASNVRSGEVSLDEMDSLARDVASTNLQLDRSEILARIHERRATAAEARSDAETAAPAAGDAAGLIDALSDPEQAAAATARLEAAGDRSVPALIAALRDPARPDLQKLLLPPILARHPSAAVLEALLAGLGGAGLEVRFRCGRAAAEVVRRMPELRCDHEVALRAMREEIACEPILGPARRTAPGDDRSASPLLSGHPDLRVARRVEHLFTLLALHLDPALAGSLLLGLHGTGARARGNALEYLEVSLPEDVRRALTTLIGIEHRAPSDRHRAARQLELELLRSAQTESAGGVGRGEPGEPDEG